MPPTLPQKYGAALRRVRIAAGWSQAQVAEACGVSQNTVSKWELGLSAPSLWELDALARAWRVAPGALVEALAA